MFAFEVEVEPNDGAGPMSIYGSSFEGSYAISGTASGTLPEPAGCVGVFQNVVFKPLFEARNGLEICHLRTRSDRFGGFPTINVVAIVVEDFVCFPLESVLDGIFVPIWTGGHSLFLRKITHTTLNSTTTNIHPQAGFVNRKKDTWEDRGGEKVPFFRTLDFRYSNILKGGELWTDFRFRILGTFIFRPLFSMTYIFESSKTSLELSK